MDATDERSVASRGHGVLAIDCELAHGADTDVLLSLLLMIFPHLALAPYLRGLDPVLGLDEQSPEQPALAVPRVVAVLSAAFGEIPGASVNPAPMRSEEVT